MVKAKPLDVEKVLSEADGFRLGVDPTPDDVHTANWLIDRLSAMAQPVTPQEAAKVLLVDDKGERLILAILGYEEDPSPAVNWIAARNCRIEDWRGRMIAGLCAIAEPPQEKDE